MLESYEANFSEWVVFQIADNCNFKKAVAGKLKISHVRCANHKLDLQVKQMIRIDT